MKKIFILLISTFLTIYFLDAQSSNTKDVDSKPKKESKKKTVSSKKTTKKSVVPNKKPVVITDTLRDLRDGNLYKFMKFGNQFWMTENLRWKSTSSFLYDDALRNEKKLGRLYSLDDSKIACPTGSHLPSKQEWDSLVKVADPLEEGLAGDALVKKTGFNATMAGFKNGKGKYVGIEGEVYYWATNTSVVFSGDMSGASVIVNPSFDNKEYKNAYSIRCVKD